MVFFPHCFKPFLHFSYLLGQAFADGFLCSLVPEILLLHHTVMAYHAVMAQQVVMHLTHDHSPSHLTL